jgi:hypothetical protein
MARKRPASTSKASGTTKGRDIKRDTRRGDLGVPEKQLDRTRGGKTPSPGGPVPVPYPN